MSLIRRIFVFGKAVGRLRRRGRGVRCDEHESRTCREEYSGIGWKGAVGFKKMIRRHMGGGVLLIMI